MPGKVHSEFSRGTEKEDISVCGQGILESYSRCEARRGGVIWAGTVLRWFHLDQVGGKGRDANPQDLGGRAESPVTDCPWDRD